MSKPTSDCRATERKHPWPMVRLGDVCRVVLGGTPKTGIPEYWDGDIPWLTPGDMGKIAQMYVDASNCKRKITQLGLDSGSTLCPARSVILSTRAPIGYVFVNSVPMATNQGCKTLVPSDDVYPEYLCFNLLGRTDELNELGTGTTFKELATGNLKAMALPLPPLSEQKEIVARLERELATVEKMKKGFEALAETAKAEFKAELKEVFEGLKSGAAEMRRIGDVCVNLDSRRIPITKADRKSGEYPYYGASGIVDSVDNYIFDGDYLLVSEDGANLLARTTPIAFSVSGKIWVNNHAHILSFAELDTQHFVEYFFASISVAEYVTGAAQPKLTQSALNDITLPFPALSVQRRIVGCLSAAKARAEKLEAKAQEGVSVCETMRKAILKEAFDSGR